MSSKRSRVDHAVKRYYLDGAGTDEIAEELGVSRRTVQRYINGPAAKDVERALAERSAMLRVEIAQSLFERLEKLDAMEEEHLKATRTIPTRWELEDVKGNVVASEDLHGEGPKATLPKPVAVEYRDIPAITKDLQVIWREQQRVEKALCDLLGLNAPDRYTVPSERHITTDEVWRVESE